MRKILTFYVVLSKETDWNKCSQKLHVSVSELLWLSKNMHVPSVAQRTATEICRVKSERFAEGRSKVQGRSWYTLNKVQASSHSEMTNVVLIDAFFFWILYPMISFCVDRKADVKKK